MARLKVLAAALLLGSVPAVAAPGDRGTTGRAHRLEGVFELGRKAFERGDYRGSLRLMTEVMLADPSHRRARSYAQASADRLEKVRLKAMARGRAELERSAAPLIEPERLKADIWNALVVEGGRARSRGEHALASDRYHHVLRENPLHGDALQGLRLSQQGIAARLDARAFADLKEQHVYRGFFRYNKREREAARIEFRRALALQGYTELSDLDLRAYLEELGGEPETDEPEREKPSPARAAPPEPAEASAPVAPAAAAAPPAPRIASAPAPAKAPPAEPELDLAQRRAKMLAASAAKLARVGRLEEAMDAYSELLLLAPDHPGAREEAFRVSARLNEVSGTRREAAEALYRTGLAEYAAGRVEGARDAWKRAVAADPGHPYALNALDRSLRELEGGRR